MSFLTQDLVIILNPPSIEGLAGTVVAAATPAAQEPSLSGCGGRGGRTIGDNAVVAVGRISGVRVVALLVALEHGQQKEDGADCQSGPGAPRETEGVAAQVGVAAVAGEMVAHLDEGGAVIVC